MMPRGPCQRQRSFRAVAVHPIHPTPGVSEASRPPGAQGSRLALSQTLECSCHGVATQLAAKLPTETSRHALHTIKADAEQGGCVSDDATERHQRIMSASRIFGWTFEGAGWLLIRRVVVSRKSPRC